MESRHHTKPNTRKLLGDHLLIIYNQPLALKPSVRILSERLSGCFDFSTQLDKTRIICVIKSSKSSSSKLDFVCFLSEAVM